MTKAIIGILIGLAGAMALAGFAFTIHDSIQELKAKPTQRTVVITDPATGCKTELYAVAPRSTTDADLLFQVMQGNVPLTGGRRLPCEGAA